MCRTDELIKIIIDAEQKELLIEQRVEEGNLTLEQQFNHLHMYQMNVRRRLAAQKELKTFL